MLTRIDLRNCYRRWRGAVISASQSKALGVVLAVFAGCVSMSAIADTPDTPAVGDTSTSLEEVQVTARRISEDIQRVPMTVEAFSSV
jgi:hypothetical protein